jgi:putative transposase
MKRDLSDKLRMPGKDYRDPGWYFVTLGTDYHRTLFGEVIDGRMMPNDLGRLVERNWQAITAHYPHVRLGAFMVMPNHFHGIIQIRPFGNEGGVKAKSLGAVVNGFKGSVTREWRRAVFCYSKNGQEEAPIRVWQPNYWDVICFDAEELKTRERYILENPLRWWMRNVPRGVIKQSRYSGNVELMKAVPKLALRVSRRAGEGEIEALKEKMRQVEGVVVSTFVSPGERACLEVLLRDDVCCSKKEQKENDFCCSKKEQKQDDFCCSKKEQKMIAGIIWVMPMGLPKQVFGKWAKAFAEGRALWLSAYGDDAQDATRERCLECNGWVEKLCQA